MEGAKDKTQTGRRAGNPQRRTGGAMLGSSEMAYSQLLAKKRTPLPAIDSIGSPYLKQTVSHLFPQKTMQELPNTRLVELQDLTSSRNKNQWLLSQRGLPMGNSQSVVARGKGHAFSEKAHSFTALKQVKAIMNSWGSLKTIADDRQGSREDKEEGKQSRGRLREVVTVQSREFDLHHGQGQRRQNIFTKQPPKLSSFAIKQRLSDLHLQQKSKIRMVRGLMAKGQLVPTLQVNSYSPFMPGHR